MSSGDFDEYSTIEEEAIYSDDEGGNTRNAVSEYGDDESLGEESDTQFVPLEEVDPEEYVRSSVRELVMWEHPIHTALWATVLGLMFFLIIVSGYSLVTIVSYLVLVQVVGTTVVVRFSDKLKSINVLRESFDSEAFADQRQLVPPAELMIVVKGAGAWAAGVVQGWQAKVTRGDGKSVVKSSAGVVLMSILGMLVPTTLLALIMYVLAFSLPVLYKRKPVRKVVDKELKRLNKGIDKLLVKTGLVAASSRSRGRTSSSRRSYGSSTTEPKYYGDLLRNEPGFSDAE